MIYVVLGFILLNGFFMLVEFGSVLMKLKEQHDLLRDQEKRIKSLENTIDILLDQVTEIHSFTDDVDLELTNKVLHEFMETTSKKKTKKKKERADLESVNEFYDSAD